MKTFIFISTLVAVIAGIAIAVVLWQRQPHRRATTVSHRDGVHVETSKADALNMSVVTEPRHREAMLGSDAPAAHSDPTSVEAPLRISSAGTDRRNKTTNDQSVYRPAFNAAGSSEIIYVEPGQRVALTVEYPDGAPGDTVLAQAMDGGDFVEQEQPVNRAAVKLSLDERKTAGLTFAVGQNLGRYRVVLRHGMQTKMVELWAGLPLAVATE